MKTAVSIPNDVFDEAEQLARERQISRSELYTIALRKFIADDALVTERLNQIHGTPDSPDEHAVDPDVDAFVYRAARQTFARTDW